MSFNELYDDTKHRFRIYTDYDKDRAYIRTYTGTVILTWDLSSKPHKIKTIDNDIWRVVDDKFDFTSEALRLMKLCGCMECKE